MNFGIEAGPHTLELAVELGVRGVPVDGSKIVTEGVEAALAPLRERGLDACQLGLFGFNPLHPDAAERMRLSALLAQLIPRAAQTGCPYIVVCGGNHHPSGFGAADPRNFTAGALEAVAAALAPHLAAAEHNGVKICIEAYLKTAVGTVDRFLELKQLAPSPALRANIDVTSLYGFAELVDPRDAVRDICARLGPHCGIVHVKEFALGEGAHLHAGLVPLGSGPTDWAEFLRLIAPHVPGDSWVILEHILTPEEGRASVAFLRAAAKKAGVLLR